MYNNNNNNNSNNSNKCEFIYRYEVKNVCYQTPFRSSQNATTNRIQLIKNCLHSCSTQKVVEVLNAVVLPMIDDLNEQ